MPHARRDARFNRRAEQAAYDPVLQRFRDPDQEKAVRRAEEAKKIRAVNRGKV
jgi:hypothetical protein